MDPQWQTYADPSLGRASQFNPQGSHPAQLNPKYSGLPTQAQPPAGYTYESYQTPAAATKAPPPIAPTSKSVSMASSPAARDYVADTDTPMEDADPYNRSKYPRSTHQIRPSSQYLPNEELSAQRRYSPMNILSPSLPYNASPSKSQNSYGPSSSRQSPTRTSGFPSPSQTYQSPRECFVESYNVLLVHPLADDG
jgi:dual specificity protein kinase YAK1